VHTAIVWHKKCVGVVRVSFDAVNSLSDHTTTAANSPSSAQTVAPSTPASLFTELRRGPTRPAPLALRGGGNARTRNRSYTVRSTGEGDHEVVEGAGAHCNRVA
jgi:hypothetical protein